MAEATLCRPFSDVQVNTGIATPAWYCRPLRGARRTEPRSTQNDEATREADAGKAARQAAAERLDGC